MSLSDVERNQEDPLEKQADEWVEQPFIPPEIGDSSAAKNHPTTVEVQNLSNPLKIHTAIGADQVRYIGYCRIL